MAMQAQLDLQKQESECTIQRLVAHVGPLAHKTLKRGPSHQTSPHPAKYPTWMIQPPTPNQHTQLVDNKLYTWCTKCRHGQGLWVCRHTTDTHVDGFNQQHSIRPRYQDRNHPQLPPRTMVMQTLRIMHTYRNFLMFPLFQLQQWQHNYLFSTT